MAAALIASAPVTAGAQSARKPAAPSAANKQAAKKLVDEGIAAQDAKDYDRAIDLYKKAYALVPHPVLMFNIGQAHRLAGRPDQAAPFYKRYLTLDPGGPQAAAAHAALAAIHANTAAGSTSKTIADPPSDPVEKTPPAATASDEPKPVEPTPVEPTPVEPGGPSGTSPPVSQGATPAAGGALSADEPGALRGADTVARPGRSLRLTGIVLGGAGVVSLAVGSYFGVRMRSIRSDALADEPARAADPALDQQYRDDGAAAARNANIGFLVAGGLIAGGAMTYWLGHRKDRALETTTETTTVAPVVGAGFAGISISGSLR